MWLLQPGYANAVPPLSSIDHQPSCQMDCQICRGQKAVDNLVAISESTCFLYQHDPAANTHISKHLPSPSTDFRWLCCRNAKGRYHGYALTLPPCKLGRYLRSNVNFLATSNSQQTQCDQRLLASLILASPCISGCQMHSTSSLACRIGSRCSSCCWLQH